MGIQISTSAINHENNVLVADVSREYADHITAKDGSKIKNPLRDLRQTGFNIAIDRDAIVEEVMTGLAVPANQITGEGFGGHNPDIPMPEHDIGKAKALMAEAGHGDDLVDDPCHQRPIHQ